MRKTEKFGVARGVPILKDIPLIGFLFSGEDTEERAVETVFILTPVISTNGRPQEEILAEIERRHSTDSSSQSVAEAITDPFGAVARQHSQNPAKAQEERAHVEADVKNVESQAALRQANERVQKAQEQLKALQDEIEQIKADTRKIQAEAEETRAAQQNDTDIQKSTDNESETDTQEVAAEST